jgi:MFS family permease
LLALVSLTGMPYVVLMPVFARGVLGGGPHILGALMAATGVGAVIGALYLASRRSVLGLSRVIVVGGGLFGLGLIAFSYSRSLWLSLILLVFTGGGMMVQMASSNTLLQTLVDERMRGRVMSFYTMAFFGMAPLGSLCAGLLGDRFGAPTAVRVGGVATLVGVLIFLRKLPNLRRTVRPIYERLGILPEVAQGLRQAADTETPPAE